MVEKMARAIWASKWDEPFPRGGSIQYELAFQNARVALQALMEPSEEMLNAAWDTDRQNVGEHGNTLMPEEVWKAMLRAAIGEDDG